MKITREYNADTLVTKVTSLVEGIASLEAKYNNSITNLNNNTNKINFANVWDDPVQKAVETYVESLKSDTQTIDSDISSGNFQNLKRKLNELLSEAETFQANKIKLKEREEKLQAERNKDKDDRDDSVIASLNSAVNSSKSMIDRNVERINTLLKDISNIEFNKEYNELELPIPMIEPVDIEEPQEVPQEEPQEAPEENVYGSLKPYSGNSDLLYDTFEYFDDNGNIRQYEILINPKDGSVIVGNNSTYYIYCMAPDGTVHAGTINSSAIKDYNLQNVAYLITDGHQNKSEGPLTLHSTVAYGANNEITPSGGLAGSHYKITIGGQEMVIGSENYSDGPVHQYFEEHYNAE